jgi:hypothetical protein
MRNIYKIKGHLDQKFVEVEDPYLKKEKQRRIYFPVEM